MSNMVQVGSPPADLLVPHTTLPDLLCHTITDKELDLLTDRSATVVGGIASAAFGVLVSSIPGAIPAGEAIALARFAESTTTDFVYLGLVLISGPVFFLTLVLSGIHLWKRKSYASKIRARPKMPMRYSETTTP